MNDCDCILEFLIPRHPESWQPAGRPQSTVYRAPTNAMPIHSPDSTLLASATVIIRVMGSTGDSWNPYRW